MPGEESSPKEEASTVSESTSAVEWVKGNAGLVATIAAFAFVILKVLAVSKFDSETAAALVSTAGAASVILGVLTSSFVTIASLVLLINPAACGSRG